MNVLNIDKVENSSVISVDQIKAFRAKANTAKASKDYASIISTVATQALVRSASVSKQLFNSTLTLLSNSAHIERLNATQSIIESMTDALKHNVKIVAYIAVAVNRKSNNFLYACAQALTENENATKENVRAVMRQYNYAESTDVQVSMTLNTLKALRAIDCDTRNSKDNCVITRDENFEIMTTQFLNHSMSRKRSA